MISTEIKNFIFNQINLIIESGISIFFNNSSSEKVYDCLPDFSKKNDKEFEEYIEEVGINEFKVRIIQEILLLDEELAYSNHDIEWVEGNNEYVWFIKRLQKISQNNLQLSNLEEVWCKNDDDNEILINFEFENIKHTIKPEVDGDWADEVLVLMELNKLLIVKSFSFYYLFDGEVIIGLNTKQKEVIEKLGFEIIFPKK